MPLKAVWISKLAVLWKKSLKINYIFCLLATITLITFIIQYCIIYNIDQLLMKINIEFKIELEIFISTKSHLNMDIFVLHKYSKEKLTENEI